MQNGATPSGTLIQLAHTGWEAFALGKQRGVTGSKHAVLPVIGFGHSKLEHYRAAIDCAKNFRDPWHKQITTAADFQFAAERVAGAAGQSRQGRQRLKGLFRELSQRAKPLSAALRAAASSTALLYLMLASAELDFVLLSCRYAKIAFMPAAAGIRWISAIGLMAWECNAHALPYC